MQNGNTELRMHQLALFAAIGLGGAAVLIPAIKFDKDAQFPTVTAFAAAKNVAVTPGNGVVEVKLNRPVGGAVPYEGLVASLK